MKLSIFKRKPPVDNEIADYLVFDLGNKEGCVINYYGDLIFAKMYEIRTIYEELYML